MGRKMGIRTHAITFIHNILDAQFSSRTPYGSLEGKHMIEMGNMYIRKDAIEWIERNKFRLDGFSQIDNGMIAKEYWTALGCKHTSIDLNMKEGALPIDLRQSIKNNDTNRLVDSADIVIDSGTSEHVEYQYMNWKNLYDIAKVGAVFIHCLPKIGHYPNHCEYKYDIEFFVQLARENDYQILELSNSYSSAEICAAYRKTNNKGFMSENTFNKLPLHICKPEGKPELNDRVLYPWAYNK